MLITLGGLVAIDYAGVYGFWRTWPILIIVFGVLKLAERAGAGPTPPSYPNQYPSGQYPGTPQHHPSQQPQPGEQPPGGSVI
jgi:hypothetical protein